METPNYGKLRVGIDFYNKGWVNFGQWAYHSVSDSTLNIYPNPQIFYSLPGHQIGGTAPETLELLFDPLNNYGFEVVHLARTTSGSVTFGVANGVATVPVTGSTEYTFWFWIKSAADYTNDGTHTLTVTVTEYVSDLSTSPASTLVNFDTTNAPSIAVGTRVHFTTDPSSAFISFTISKVDSDSTPIDFKLMGVMLLTGNVTAEPVWCPDLISSDTGVLDEITDYLVQAQGSIGKTQWENTLFSEGQLTLTLNNEDKRFSPEYSSSPYYTYLLPYRRVFVLLSDSSDEYHLIWSGFTQQVTLQTGIFNSRQATITCRQGLYAIEAEDVTKIAAADNITSADAIRVLFNGGYECATGSIDTTKTERMILEVSDDGTTIPIFGTDFVGSSLQNQTGKGYTTALQNISELNGNYLLLSRNNRIIFRDYNSVLSDVPVELDYGLMLDATYVYSPMDLFQSIVVNYDVYAFASSGYEMEGQRFTIPYGSSGYPFNIYPSYNGKPFIGGVVLDVSSFLPVDYTRTATSGSANATFTMHTNGIYTWYTASANNDELDGIGGIDTDLALVSRASSNVWYCTAPNKQITVTGTDPLGLINVAYNNPLITTDTMATDFASMEVARRTAILSWFSDGRISNKSTSSIDFIINHSLGSVIKLAEDQMGNLYKVLMIIGENFTWYPNYFEMQYHFAPTGAVIVPCDSCAIDAGTQSFGGTDDGSGVGTINVTSLPTSSNCDVETITLHWGDGSSDIITTTGTYTHTYAANGTYFAYVGIVLNTCDETSGNAGSIGISGLTSAFSCTYDFTTGNQGWTAVTGSYSSGVGFVKSGSTTKIQLSGLSFTAPVQNMQAEVFYTVDWGGNNGNPGRDVHSSFTGLSSGLGIGTTHAILSSVVGANDVTPYVTTSTSHVVDTFSVQCQDPIVTPVTLTITKVIVRGYYSDTSPC